MQTMYYKTSSFIQHTGNVVDLEEYRRKAALARENFHKNPDAVYKLMLAALTGDRAYAQEYFAQ